MNESFIIFISSFEINTDRMTIIMRRSDDKISMVVQFLSFSLCCLWNSERLFQYLDCLFILVMSLRQIPYIPDITHRIHMLNIRYYDLASF